MRVVFYFPFCTIPPLPDRESCPVRHPGIPAQPRVAGLRNASGQYSEACCHSRRRGGGHGKLWSLLVRLCSDPRSKACAAKLAQHPAKFKVTVLERASVAGGQATSISLDANAFGADWMNNGVQGGSPVRPLPPRACLVFSERSGSLAHGLPYPDLPTYLRIL